MEYGVDKKEFITNLLRVYPEEKRIDFLSALLIYPDSLVNIIAIEELRKLEMTEEVFALLNAELENDDFVLRRMAAEVLIEKDITRAIAVLEDPNEKKRAVITEEFWRLGTNDKNLYDLFKKLMETDPSELARYYAVRYIERYETEN